MRPRFRLARARKHCLNGRRTLRGSGVSRRGCAWYPTSMSTTLPRFPERYVHAERVASGGMGDIYTADDETLGRRVAIKLLADRYARDDAIRRRFTREALAAARLSGHPHIVTIFDVGEADEQPFIVMEYLPG